MCPMTLPTRSRWYLCSRPWKLISLTNRKVVVVFGDVPFGIDNFNQIPRGVVSEFCLVAQGVDDGGDSPHGGTAYVRAFAPLVGHLFYRVVRGVLVTDGVPLRIGLPYSFSFFYR